MKKALFFTLIIISLLILSLRLVSFPINKLFPFQDRAGIKVLSSPEGAEVYFDNQLSGKTPFESDDLEEKEMTVKILSADGDWQGKVKLHSGTLTVINKDLSKDSTASAGEILTLEKGDGVTITSQPSDAALEIDGRSLGQTPISLNISSGEHTFVLSHNGYLNRSIRATLPDGFNLNLAVELALSEADLTLVVTPPITLTTIIVIQTPTGFLRIRDKPSLQGVEIAKVKPGDELVLLEEKGDWNKVRLSDGREGYAFSQYLIKKI